VITPRPDGWPKRMADWKGMRVRARREISNRGGQVVQPGTLGTLVGAHGGVSVSFNVCEHCGTRMHVRGMDPRDLERVED